MVCLPLEKPEQISDAANFVRRVESIQENLPAQFLYSQMNLISSHDKPRALTVLADVGDMERLMPHDEGVIVLGGSSDHCILDIENCPRKL